MWIRTFLSPLRVVGITEWLRYPRARIPKSDSYNNQTSNVHAWNGLGVIWECQCHSASEKRCPLNRGRGNGCWRGGGPSVSRCADISLPSQCVQSLKDKTPRESAADTLYLRILSQSYTSTLTSSKREWKPFRIGSVVIIVWKTLS